jgi:predicted dehydrogenase
MSRQRREQTWRGAVIGCGLFARNHMHGWTQVDGAEIVALELAPAYRLIEHHAGSAEIADVEPKVPAWGEKPWHAIQDSVVSFQRHAIGAFEGGESPQPSGADNLKTLALAVASYEAAERENVVLMKG